MSNDDGLPNEIRLEFGAHPDVRAFRNNVGVLQDRYGNYVTYGLCVGSSDVILIRSRIITLEMVGMKFGQFGAIEAKKKKVKRAAVRTEEQKNFITMIKHMGGLAGFAESVDDARKILLL